MVSGLDGVLQAAHMRNFTPMEVAQLQLAVHHLQTQIDALRLQAAEQQQLQNANASAAKLHDLSSFFESFKKAAEDKWLEVTNKMARFHEEIARSLAGKQLELNILKNKVHDLETAQQLPDDDRPTYGGFHDNRDREAFLAHLAGDLEDELYR